MKRKFADGGWSTSTSFDEADAKRRAEEWAASRAKAKASAPAPAKRATPAPVDDRETGMKKFRDGLSESFTGKAAPKAARPKPGSEAYVDRQVSDSRASRAAQARGKASLDGVYMLDKDAPSQLRKEVAMSAATIPAIPLGGGAVANAAKLTRAATVSRKADRAAGYLGEAGQTALKGLKRRGASQRAAQSRKANTPMSEVLKKAHARGAGYAKGGKVSQYDDNEVYDNLPDTAEGKPELKSKGPSQRYTAAKAAKPPVKKFAAGGAVRGGGCAVRGKNFRHT